ncbi:tex261 protein [Anaeramoeba flamelloides]|uniref:Tex261 protein n=1 Tax=Anaeramoeba flamelloides TaxID=1746091 RepID=A0ABQ8XKB7_9EUKA|nr:tex261 protein [Anaeramoeba flamelloides]
MGFAITLQLWTSVIFLILILTISFFCGIYFLAEIANENSKHLKLFLQICIALIVVLAIFLVEDRFPIYLVVCTIATQLLYLPLLIHYPKVDLLSPEFLIGLFVTITNGITWLYFILHDRDRFILHLLALCFVFVSLTPVLLITTLSLDERAIEKISQLAFFQNKEEKNKGKSANYVIHNDSSILPSNVNSQYSSSSEKNVDQFGENSGIRKRASKQKSFDEFLTNFHDGKEQPNSFSSNVQSGKTDAVIKSVSTLTTSSNLFLLIFSITTFVFKKAKNKLLPNKQNTTLF